MRNLFLIIVLLSPCVLYAQIITTFTGNGTIGGTGDGGPATAASIGDPDGCAFDANGNFYFTTVGNEKVRKVTPDGIISTVAGTGTAGYNGDGIAATAAELNVASGIAIDKHCNIFIADAYNNRVRKIDAITGIITTVAGSSVTGFSGDGGPATAAMLYGPEDVCFDLKGNLLIADFNNHRIRKIDTAGIITSIAGTGIDAYSGDNGPATNAEIGLASGISVDEFGNIYVAQTDNYVVRKIDTAGIITTIAGNAVPGNTGDGGLATAASITLIRITCDKVGGIYISGYGASVVRKVDNTGIIHTVAGKGVAGYSGDGGPATAAELSSDIYGVALDTCGNVYIADKANARIRKIAFNPECWPAGVPDNVTMQAISIYPNPANDILHIDNIKTQASYKIQSVVGAIMQQGTLKEGSNSIPIQSLPAGMYVVEITNNEGKKTITKIIKQ